MGGLTYTFCHESKPRVKERGRHGRGGRVYTPGRTLEAEAELAAAYGDGPHFGDKLVGVRYHFFPDRTEITLYEYEGERSTLRGDYDNLAKLVGDALNGVAYDDDKQIHEAYIIKEPKES